MAYLNQMRFYLTIILFHLLLVSHSRGDSAYIDNVAEVFGESILAPEGTDVVYATRMPESSLNDLVIESGLNFKAVKDDLGGVEPMLIFRVMNSIHHDLSGKILIVPQKVMSGRPIRETGAAFFWPDVGQGWVLSLSIFGEHLCVHDKTTVVTARLSNKFYGVIPAGASNVVADLEGKGYFDNLSEIKKSLERGPISQDFVSRLSGEVAEKTLTYILMQQDG